MAVSIVDNMPIWVNGVDLTSDTNALTGEIDVDSVEKTNMGSMGSKEFIGGLKTAKLTLQSFLNTALLGAEPTLSALPGTSTVVTAVKSSAATASIGAVSDPAVFSQALCTKYSLGGKVGDIGMVNADFVARGPEPLVDGKVLFPFTSTGTGANGTSVTLGAVSSVQKAYGALHVFSVAGTSTPTLICKIQSAPLSNFASPTDRIVFANSTASGAQLLSTAGAITDTFWRVVLSFTGTSPIFGFAVVAGIA